MPEIALCKVVPQMQGSPVNVSEVQGIAKTGSGKTAAFVIPMVVHVQDQPVLEKGEGPIGVIVAPTRELAEQIHKEARRFSKPFNMRIAAGIGGLSKFEQFKDLKAGSDVSGTPFPQDTLPRRPLRGTWQFFRRPLQPWCSARGRKEKQDARGN